jgi:hypothetical protein
MTKPAIKIIYEIWRGQVRQEIRCGGEVAEDGPFRGDETGPRRPGEQRRSQSRVGSDQRLVAANLGRVAVRDFAPEVEHHDLVTDPRDGFDVMLDDEHDD